jgi:hypothetical protein
MQSVSAPQEPRQLVIARLHWYGAQLTLPPPKLQLPLPSHSTCACANPLVQLAGLHTVPEG